MLKSSINSLCSIVPGQYCELGDLSSCIHENVRKNVKVVLEHAVVDAMVIVDPGKLRLSVVFESRFLDHIGGSEESCCACVTF